MDDSVMTETLIDEQERDRHAYYRDVHDTTLREADEAMQRARIALQDGRHDVAEAAISLSRVFLNTAARIQPASEPLSSRLATCAELELAVHQAMAERLITEAQKALSDDDYTTARERFLRAQELAPSEGTKSQLDTLTALETLDDNLSRVMKEAQLFEVRRDYHRAAAALEQGQRILVASVESSIREPIDRVLNMAGLQDTSEYNDALNELDQLETEIPQNKASRLYYEIARRLLRTKHLIAGTDYVMSSVEAHRRMVQIGYPEYQHFQDTRAAWRLQSADKDLETGDYDKAHRYAQEVLDLRDVSDSVRADAQRLLQRADEYGRVAQHVTALIAEAEPLLNNGSFDQAIQILERVKWVNHVGKVKETLKAREMLHLAYVSRRQRLVTDTEPRLIQIRSTLLLVSQVPECDVLIAQINEVIRILPDHEDAALLLQDAMTMKRYRSDIEALKQQVRNALASNDVDLADNRLNAVKQLLHENPLRERAKDHLSSKAREEMEQVTARDPDIGVLEAQVKQMLQIQRLPTNVGSFLMGLVAAVLGAALEPVIQAWFKRIGIEGPLEDAPRPVAMGFFALVFALIVWRGTLWLWGQARRRNPSVASN